tara:strand:+ start:370 stop:1209 length:840 start_codon:yes stop_codon:yes gene_type:complete
MQFKTHKRRTKQVREKKYLKKDVDVAFEFAKKVNANLGGLVTAVVLFGSSFRRLSRGKTPSKPTKDIDILLILDDVRIRMTPDVVQTYRIIVKKTIADVAADRIHVQVLHLTAWWGYVRAGDPVAVNILRDGFALIDTGWFDPLQALLDAGKIRPSEEAIWTYTNMADASLFRAQSQIVSATMDLYWGVIDAAHAALMSVDAIPPNPKHVADLLRKHFVSKGELAEKQAKTMEMFFKISKAIVHKKVDKVSSKDYDDYVTLANRFVEAMKKIIKKNTGK